MIKDISRICDEESAIALWLAILLRRFQVRDEGYDSAPNLEIVAARRKAGLR